MTLTERINELFDGVRTGFDRTLAPTGDPFQSYEVGFPISKESIEGGYVRSEEIERALQRMMFAKFVMLRSQNRACVKWEGTEMLHARIQTELSPVYLYWRVEPQIGFNEGLYYIRCRALVSDKWVPE